MSGIVELPSLRADSPVANAGLFGVGVLAVAVVLVATVPGAVLGAGTPADLSPVGVSAAQPANQSGTQTPTQTANQTGNRSANRTAAVVVFDNQTTNGSVVTVKRATLPRGGFVVLHADPLEQVEYLEASMIAVSQPLSPGTHRNITLRIQHSPPGGDVNRTQLNDSGDYSVALYNDTNDNGRFEFITSGRSADRPYIDRSGTQARLVADAARITIPGSRTPTPTASIRFTNQTTNGSSITVRSVTLPDGGWVVVHNESYLRGGDPLQTVIGLSQYLPPGTHRNVSVRLMNRAVQQNQTLVAIPSRDTNANKTYDYVRSDGFQDVPYTASGGVVTDKASVMSSDSAPPTAGSPSASAAPTPTSVSTPTNTPERSRTTQSATGEAGKSENGVRAWLSSPPLEVGVSVVVGIIILPTIVRRLEQ